MPNEQTQLQMLKQEIESLKSELYKGNFSGSQDFTKYVRFNNRVKLPVYGTTPAKCEQGEVYVNSGDGKLYVCSAVNTWTAQT